jgi:hypothetical protein
MEKTFIWSMLNEDRKQLVLSKLQEGIQAEITEAIKARLRASFDADSFRRMTSKDVFKIEMVLRVPVSLIQTILQELDDEVTKISEGMDAEPKPFYKLDKPSGQGTLPEGEVYTKGTLPSSSGMGSDSHTSDEQPERQG